MNQAGSENKCSKRVSNECILNNYNFDDVSTDQNSICETCKQRGWSVCSKHTFHVETVSNTEHVLDVAEVSRQQQTGTNNSCHQSVLQKAWVYFQSVIITHMSGCPKCNPKPPSSSSVESLSQISIVSSLSSTSSPSPSSSGSPSKISCLSCMTSCERGRSPSQSRSSSQKASSPSRNARSSCQRAVCPCPKPVPPCPNVKAPCANAKRTSSDAKPTCPHIKPFCLNAKCPNPSCTNVKPSCENLQAPCPYALPTCPNAECPSAEPSCPSLHPPCPHAEPPSPHAKPPRANAKRTSSNAKPSSHIKPFCLNAKCPNPSCTNVKPSCQNLQAPCPYALPPCPNAECPSAEPSCPSLQPPCPHAEPPSPDAEPPSSHAKPPCANAKRTSSGAKPTCPHIKPFCLNAKCPNPSCTNVKPCCQNLQAPCPHAKPPCPNAKCPNAKPSCPSLQKLKNSKTSLYHSFSNDSISSICKESMVELTKIYIQKMTSDHKMRCRRCSKRSTCADSKETMTSYLRSIFDQAWSYLNMSTEENTCQPQCVLSNCSNTSTDPRMCESPSPTKLLRRTSCCVGSQPNPAKTQSCEAVCLPKPVCSTKSVTIPEPVTCPTCLTPATCTKPVPCPRPVSCPICLKPTCAKLATCPKCYKCEGTTSPAQSSKEEGTHEHKSCDTPCCVHNSQGVQPSYIMTDKSCWSSQTPVNPLFKRSCQIKTPQSVEELKASITGMTCLDKSSGNMVGCEIVDFRSSIKYPKPCVQDLKVSRESICSTDIPPPKLGHSLTMEQKDHAFGTQPKECRHSKDSLDNCEHTMSSCNDLREQTCKEDVTCPSSGGHAKSNEVLLDKDFGSKPREQADNKDKICKSGHNSVTCVDNNHPDLKDCNATEIDAYRKDPYNYKYYY